MHVEHKSMRLTDYLHIAHDWVTQHISELSGTTTGVAVGIAKTVEQTNAITLEHVLQVALFGFVGGAAGFIAKELGSYIKLLFTKKPKK